MIRILHGMTAADARQELQLMGDTSLDRERVRQLCRGVALKLISYPTKDLQEITEVIQQTGGLEAVYAAGEAGNGSLLIHFPNSQLEEIPQMLHSVLPEQFSALVKKIRNCVDGFFKEEWDFNLPGRKWRVHRPVIMGILNVTPDSFSDGGQFLRAKNAYRHAREMMEAGAEIIDIGGESTRPGASPVSETEEWERISPVLKKLSRLKECIISVDTVKSEVARRALAEGAHIINDISAMQFDPHMAEVAAAYQAPVVLMHIQGVPKTMQQKPHYHHLMEEVFTFLSERVDYATSRGVEQLIIDPGIGFGKRLNDNFELIRRLGELRGLGYPILLGASRKSFIGKITEAPPEERGSGTVAANLYGFLNGAHIFRVHDVREAIQSLAVWQGIATRKQQGVENR